MIAPILGPLVRHLLTIVSGILIAKGLPGLTEGTVANLGDILLAAAGILAALVWSYAAKVRTPKR